MDRRDLGLKEHGYNEELKKEEDMNIDTSKEYINENGKLVRMPYKIVKRVVFSNLKKEELIDQPHAARLQYRLMLLEPVIKAYVNYNKEKITIIYNPKDANNIKDKTSLEELKDFLAKEGVHIDEKSTKEENFDYYTKFYSYAFNPSRIRVHPPYGTSIQEWEKRKNAFEKETSKQKALKWQKFLEWQKKYKQEHKEILESM